MRERNSSIIAWYFGMHFMVRSESGFFPIRSNSPAIGWKMVAKCVAKPAPAANSATGLTFQISGLMRE